MAEIVVVRGACQVRVATGEDSALETLGYTRNGADITLESMFLDVPGDQNGGDDGPPIDVQYLGDIARVRLELTKWDEAVADKLLPRLRGGTAGTPGAPGTLMFQDSKSYRLLLNSASEPRNFLRTFPRMPIEMNAGTKFTTLVIEFECHENENGILYNEIAV